MALKPIRPRLRNISNDVAKVQITVPAGDEVEVSERVADQIARQGAPLRESTPPTPKADAEPAKKAPAKKKAAARKASAPAKD